jgi:hypothetical protein
MKLVIFGSRGIEDMGAVENAMESCGTAAKVTEIVSGGARGVDRLGERYARQRGLHGFILKYNFVRVVAYTEDEFFIFQ